MLAIRLDTSDATYPIYIDPIIYGSEIKLTASGGAASDEFGFAVSVWGDVAIVGAEGDDSQRGSTYIFERNAHGTNACGQVKKLTASDGVASDIFGTSVSIWGDVAFIGASRYDSYRGSVYIFERNAGGTNAWGQVKKLTASDGAARAGTGRNMPAAGCAYFHRRLSGSRPELFRFFNCFSRLTLLKFLSGLNVLSRDTHSQIEGTE